jgi:hypothetical protein
MVVAVETTAHRLVQRARPPSATSPLPFGPSASRRPRNRVFFRDHRTTVQRSSGVIVTLSRVVVVVVVVIIHRVIDVVSIIGIPGVISVVGQSAKEKQSLCWYNTTTS